MSKLCGGNDVLCGFSCLGSRYRVASLIRNNPLLGPYSRFVPRDLW